MVGMNFIRAYFITLTAQKSHAMNHMIDILAELGRRLEGFGRDSRSAECIDRAVAANGWFTAADVIMAVDAIRTEFLRRDKLEAWLGRYPRTIGRRRVAIVMAGNIPLVGFFDLMCVLACGHEAAVKSSSKDSVLTAYVIDTLREIYPDIPVIPYDDSQPCDMAIATGGDAAAAYFRTRYASMPALIRGSRHSVAVLADDETADMLAGLQRDVFSYGGLGCRNISLILLPRGTALPLRPIQPQSTPRRNNYLQTRAMLEMTGVRYTDLESCVAVEQWAFPETASRVNYAFYDSLTEVCDWIAQHDAHIQCVASQCVGHPRRCDLGRTQYPTLTDYADGVDVMEFLTQQ